VAHNHRIGKKFSKRNVLGVGLGLAVVVATFAFILPKIADYRDVWGVVKGLSWKDVALLAGATLLNLVTFAPPWMAALPGLRFRQAFVVTQASTASTYVAPGGVAVGMALSFAMLRAWGFVSAAVGLAVALTGIWNQLAMLAFPALALVLLTFTGDAHTALDTVAYLGFAIFLAVVAAFTAALSTPKLARRVGDLAARVVSWAKRLIRRKPVGWDGESFVRFRDRTNALLKRRWHVLTLATLAGHFTVFLVLLTSLRVLDVTGSEVSAAEAFAAWSLVRLLGSIPITPGGLGVVELGLTTALVGFGGDQPLIVKSFVQQTLAHRGILFNGSMFICARHSDDDIARTLTAFDEALADVAKGGDLGARLVGPPVQPVFRSP